MRIIRNNRCYVIIKQHCSLICLLLNTILEHFMPNTFAKVVHFMLQLKFNEVKGITCRMHENIYDTYCLTYRYIIGRYTFMGINKR